MDASPFSEYRAAICRLLEDKGLELPSIPNCAGRAAYLALLADSGYSESEVLPVVDTAKVTPNAMAATLVGLINAIELGNAELIQSVAWIALNSVGGRDNTNLILHGLKEHLFRDIELGNEARACYVGVFPTNSFNAQCRRYLDRPLVLLDTGCVELVEAAAASFLSKKPQSEKVNDLVTLSVAYFSSRSRADVSCLSLPGVNWGNADVSILATAAEEFVIAHELGHLSLGHLDASGRRTYSLPNGRPAEVVEKSRRQEFEADAWACSRLIKRAVANASSMSQVAVALMGPIVILGTGAVMEAAAKSRHIPLSAGHPPAIQRMGLIFQLFDHFKVGQHNYMAAAFVQLVQACLEALNAPFNANLMVPEQIEDILATLH